MGYIRGCGDCGFEKSVRGLTSLGYYNCRAIPWSEQSIPVVLLPYQTIFHLPQIKPPNHQPTKNPQHVPTSRPHSATCATNAASPLSPFPPLCRTIPPPTHTPKQTTTAAITLAATPAAAIRLTVVATVLVAGAALVVTVNRSWCNWGGM